jgi:hypothetical protein
MPAEQLCDVVLGLQANIANSQLVTQSKATAFR